MNLMKKLFSSIKGTCLGVALACAASGTVDVYTSWDYERLRNRRPVIQQEINSIDLRVHEYLDQLIKTRGAAYKIHSNYWNEGARTKYLRGDIDRLVVEVNLLETLLPVDLDSVDRLIELKKERYAIDSAERTAKAFDQAKFYMYMSAMLGLVTGILGYAREDIKSNQLRFI